MQLTLFGVAVILIGVMLLLRGSMTAMLIFTICTTLMGGSAAIQLPALGGSSIPPANLALIFLLLRAVLPGTGQMEALAGALRNNVLLVIFAVYGSIGAWILPRMFARQGDFTPLKPAAVRELYEAAPIHFSSQNITTSVYLLGTLAAGLGAFLGAARPGAAARLVNTAIVIALVHALLGFISVAVADTPLDVVIEYFRNGNYAQLDQTISGLSRMNGIWPEASGFAAYGAGWFIFMTELWIRDVRPRGTGIAALVLGSALALSTSSTAYVALAGYSATLMIRILLFPRMLSLRKLAALGAFLFFALTACVALLVLRPGLLDTAGRILATMTVDKADSFSGRQRAYWAQQGLDAFLLSGGLGIGAGTFRSSSLITAILGSMGAIGIVAFAGHLLLAFKPLRASTHYAAPDFTSATGAAASWTCLLMLAPAAVASPSPDPGVVWAIFAGAAIALRSGSNRTPAFPTDTKLTAIQS